LSCGATGSEREKLLRQSIKLNPEMAYALLALGRLLRNQGDSQGLRHIENAVRVLEREMSTHRIDKDHCRRLIEAAKEIGAQEVADMAQARLDSMLESSVYEEANLAVPIQGQQQLGRR
jgi:hypothetical protein